MMEYWLEIFEMRVKVKVKMKMKVLMMILLDYSLVLESVIMKVIMI